MADFMRVSGDKIINLDHLTLAIFTVVATERKAVSLKLVFRVGDTKDSFMELRGRQAEIVWEDLQRMSYTCSVVEEAEP